MAKRAGKKRKEPRRAIQVGATALSVLPAEVDAVDVHKRFRVTVNGLIADGDPSLEEYAEVGINLRVLERCSPFAIGDFVLFAERRFGEAASQLLDADTGWSEKTLAVYRWLAERIAPERRRMDRLGVRHHLMVAALPAAKQSHWLVKACAYSEPEPWTVAKMQHEMTKGGVLPDTHMFVEVFCPNGTVQAELLDRLEAEGLTCRAISRKVKVKAALEAPAADSQGEAGQVQEEA